MLRTMTLRTLVCEQAISAEGNFQIAALLRFWTEAGEKRWFSKSAEFDAEFRARFLDLHLLAASRMLDLWLETASGALALVLLLDQFPRNAFRNTAHMYATVSLALSFAEYAIEQHHDTEVASDLRLFLYLPFTHSEDITHQERSLILHGQIGNSEHAIAHHDIIRRFGRFPHRNAVLLRISTPAELAFLETGGFAG